MRSVFAIFFLFLALHATAGDSTRYNQAEIIYGRKDGMALTMTRLDPLKPKGKAIIRVVSGNWKSDYTRLQRSIAESEPFLENGYTVFAVLPSSQPRYNMIDEVADIKRAVRFIRYNAAAYGIDPDHIGITGSSSGGHLSLMVATADEAQESNGDPVNAVSSRVQAVVAFFPPTDFSNFGLKNMDFAMTQKILVMTGVAGAFDFKEWSDSTQTYVSITNMEKKQALSKQVSPINFVTPDDPPTLLLHGDKDRLVPLQQSQSILAKYKAASVPAELIVHEGGGHGWKPDDNEVKRITGWFDQYLK